MIKKNLLTIILIFILTKGLFGQDSLGYIKIYCHDKKTKNLILDSFTVNLTDNNNRSIGYKLKPNSDGYAEIKFLSANKYSVSVISPGYQTLQFNKIIVDGIHSTYLSFPLTSLSDVKTKKGNTRKIKQRK